MEFIDEKILEKFGKQSIYDADLDIINAIKKNYTDEVFIFYRLKKLHLTDDCVVGSVFGHAKGNRDLLKDLIKGMLKKDENVALLFLEAVFEFIKEKKTIINGKE